MGYARKMGYVRRMGYNHVEKYADISPSCTTSITRNNDSFLLFGKALYNTVIIETFFFQCIFTNYRLQISLDRYTIKKNNRGLI
jgi:hypothetical protein